MDKNNHNRLTAQLALTGVIALGGLAASEIILPSFNIAAYADDPSPAPSPELTPGATESPAPTPSPTETALTSSSDTATVTILPSPSATPSKAPALVITHKQKKLHTVLDGHGVDMYVPGNAKVQSVVILQHKYTGNPTELIATTKLAAEAAKRDWLVMAVGGIHNSWNAGKCCGVARDTNQADLDFLNDTINYAHKKFGLGEEVPIIDGGISNGAMLAASMACKYPRRIDAAILDSGNLEDPTCRTAHVNNILMMRGANDPVVKINGTPYSLQLRTTLLSDKFTSDAFMRGSTCRVTYDNNQGGIHSTVTQCGSRTLKYVVGQGEHRWNSVAQPGIPNETKLATDFIVGITVEKQRVARLRRVKLQAAAMALSMRTRYPQLQA